MLIPHNPRLEGRERALGDALCDVAAELRLVEVADYVTFIRTEQFANIQDLVNSSAELFFKPGTLSYGWAADLVMGWCVPPKVTLDMEFRHRDVTVFFGLTLEERCAGVDIRSLVFERPSADPDANTDHFLAALADARLRPAEAG